MLDIKTVYDDVVKDTANADQNGQLSYQMFTRLSRRAELRMLEWLSGPIDGNPNMPAPWKTQKNKDWLSPLIKKYPAQVVNGTIDRPSDYYLYEDFYRIGSKSDADCDDDVIVTDDCNTPIELLDGQQYYQRCRTYIDELKPSLDKPIAKLVGNKFEVLPKDLGSVELEYIALPVFGSITGKVDPIYNDEVPDVVVNYSWDERSRPLLIWFIVDEFSNHVSSQSMKQFNQASNPKQ